MGILFFQPIARPAIWGHTLLKDYFGYQDFPEGIGQSWAFSAQEGASTVCISEPYKGMTLRQLWENHQELFGHPQEDFPVIISLVAPEDDLSIQVHPDQQYAQKLGLLNGKNEAWYFIDSKPNSSIVYGHHAHNKEELKKYISEEKWEDLICHKDVHTGDFVYLPAGLLHALKKGSIVYEIQQSTDITYRFYDYHRKDEHGQERELHLKQAMDCLSYDPEIVHQDVLPIIHQKNQITETIFIDNQSFTVTKLEVNGQDQYKCSNYQLATVIQGKGIVDNDQVQLGDSFLIPMNSVINLQGNFVLMMTTRR